MTCGKFYFICARRHNCPLLCMTASFETSSVSTIAAKIKQEYLMASSAVIQKIMTDYLKRASTLFILLNLIWDLERFLNTSGSH